MVDVYIITDALVTSSLLALLTIGLSLTYLTTKVPNFAHGSFASVGIYVGLVVAQVFGLNIYLGIVPGFFVGGLVAIAQYLLFLRPMTKRNASITTLMIATIAFDIFLVAILNIFADYLQNPPFRLNARDFQLFYLDFSLYGIKGIVFVAPMLVVGVVIGLYLLLNKTKFGIAMRATIENPPLAGTIGINADSVYIVSWFLAGGIAGMAGSITTLWYIGNTNVGSDFFLISIFAAAVLGGVFSIYGAGTRRSNNRRSSKRHNRCASSINWLLDSSLSTHHSINRNDCHTTDSSEWNNRHQFFSTQEKTGER